jgi:hypothetical protein
MSFAAFAASATDVAGNTTTTHATFTVSVTYDSLCALTRQLSSKDAVATSLCQMLANASAAANRGDTKTATNVVTAYRNQVGAQSGDAFTAAEAALLRSLAAAL